MGSSLTLSTAAPVDIDAPFTPPDDLEPSPAALAVVGAAVRYREEARLWRSRALEMKRRDIINLGRDQAFVVRDRAGTVRCVKAVVRLTVEEKHLYQVQGSWRVTADGYTKINAVAGVTIVQPEAIVIDGVPRENPWMETHPANPGVLQRVHVRVLSVGRSRTGQPVVIDYRLKFDPNLYLAQALTKVQDGVWEGPKGNRRKVSPTGAVENMLQSEFREAKARGELRGWAFIALTSVMGDFVGLAINTAHSAVKDKMGAHVDLIGFAERRAQTIARRNALRHHPAIGVTAVVPRITSDNDSGSGVTGYVDVEVYGWPPDSARTLKEIGDLVVSGTANTAAAITADASADVTHVVVEGDAEPDDDGDEPDVTEAESREVHASNAEVVDAQVPTAQKNAPASQGGLFEDGDR